MVIENYDPLKGQMLQVLDAEGNLAQGFDGVLKNDDVLKLYQVMTLSRMTDKKALAMQRQGRLITYIPQSGQEAAAAASVYALTFEDWIVPAFREMAGWLLRGAKLKDVFLYLRGNEQGSKNMPKLRMTPLCVPIGSQIPHGVGISWAQKLKGENSITIVYFGDGATSEGEFHEAMNFGGVFKTPTIFFCMNNQWAISLPRSLQTSSKTLAQKAVAYGFPGVLVDGNDIFAVYLATKEAAERARQGKGPTMIEAYTYRQGPHTTADDPRKYRSTEEEEKWLCKDPVSRVRKFLEKRDLWDDKKQAALEAECDKIIEEAVAEAEKTSYIPEDIFKYHYAEMPQELQEQFEYFKSTLGGQHG
ncbi:pyruvate dehydrogenase (acetyl-transferring) E1 component subunit alpha [Candidatus Woesearchaeota archaeon]|nr:pyruvate dehydrogenase (acetyl-transferring) E1 component subunit alpha [Candidatus Woesearchaeota archaeon]